jgi:hypothetical protein
LELLVRGCNAWTTTKDKTLVWLIPVRHQRNKQDVLT